MKKKNQLKIDDARSKSAQDNNSHVLILIWYFVKVLRIIKLNVHEHFTLINLNKKLNTKK